jgi:hypothetical protein
VHGDEVVRVGRVEGHRRDVLSVAHLDTIPVKITVTGCDGGVVSTLTPQVNLLKGDSTPEFPVNEEVYSGSATNGKLMRWDATGQQYIYNLSTKLSQFTGAALGAGTYTVAVNDASFSAPVTATFDLRK